MSSIASRIRRHLADPESHHRRIAEGFLWVSLFVFVGKLAGAAKEMAIAWRYGVSETVDAYVFVFNLVNWPVSVWFSVLTVVLVPLLARIRHQNPGELPRFRGELLGLTLLAGLGLGILAWFGLPALLRAGWFGLSDKAAAEALNMSYGLALLVPMGLVISLFSTLMLADGRHRNTLFEGIPPLTILFVLLLPPGWIPEPLLWGTVAGFALHMAALAAPLQQQGELQTPRVGFTSPAWQGFWNSVGIMAVGQVLTSFTGIIDQFFAAELGPGALSTLNYANRILALILGLGAMTIGRASLPVFSQAQARGVTDVKALALKWALWMFLAGIAVAAAGALLSPYLVKLLFERGAFTTDNTHAVAIVFGFSLIQVPFYFSAMVLVTALSSGGHYALIAVSGASNLLFKLLFALPLVEYFQLNGLVISTSAMYAVSLAILYVAVRVVPARGNMRGRG